MSSGLTEATNLTLEDGTGLFDANTYVDIASADLYAHDRQYGVFVTWIAADESNKVSALITATKYIDQRWRFAGVIFEDGDGVPEDAQALTWPRAADVLDANGIEVSELVPVQIEEATYEYAARAINSATLEAIELQADVASQDASGRTINRKREKLGPLEEETYFGGSGNARIKWTDYGTADQIVRRSGLLSAGGESIARA